ncbi:zf-HC2 domain-containing protein [Teredinibacter turnerae]|uniref:anti-sigma factor family protein n=1 Tax=Teredinibacter turnerae TaxID=2426 RepID=UPI0003625910|nr:zf-HC2 domain-containing protein [Teredinibacter turnerae]
MNTDCEVLSPLISGLVDGELTQQQGQRINQHLAICSTCRERYEQLNTLKKLTGDYSLISQDERQEEVLRTDQMANWLAWGGWLLLLIVAMLMGFAVIFTVIHSDMLWWQRCFVGSLTLGFLLLFASVLRQQLKILKTDKFRKVNL